MKIPCNFSYRNGRIKIDFAQAGFHEDNCSTLIVEKMAGNVFRVAALGTNAEDFFNRSRSEAEKGGNAAAGATALDRSKYTVSDPFLPLSGGTAREALCYYFRKAMHQRNMRLGFFRSLLSGILDRIDLNIEIENYEAQPAAEKLEFEKISSRFRSLNITLNGKPLAGKNRRA